MFLLTIVYHLCSSNNASAPALGNEEAYSHVPFVDIPSLPVSPGDGTCRPDLHDMQSVNLFNSFIVPVFGKLNLKKARNT